MRLQLSPLLSGPNIFPPAWRTSDQAGNRRGKFHLKIAICGCPPALGNGDFRSAFSICGGTIMENAFDPAPPTISTAFADRKILLREADNVAFPSASPSLLTSRNPLADSLIYVCKLFS